MEHDALEFRILIVLGVGIIILGMFSYHHLEGWSYVDSLYFSVATLTTVGYGDFVPHSTNGKIFTIIFILLGVGIILEFISVLSRNRIRRIGRLRKKH